MEVHNADAARHFQPKEGMEAVEKQLVDAFFRYAKMKKVSKKCTSQRNRYMDTVTSHHVTLPVSLM